MYQDSPEQSAFANRFGQGSSLHSRVGGNNYQIGSYRQNSFEENSLGQVSPENACEQQMSFRSMVGGNNSYARSFRQNRLHTSLNQGRLEQDSLDQSFPENSLGQYMSYLSSVGDSNRNTKRIGQDILEGGGLKKCFPDKSCEKNMSYHPTAGDNNYDNKRFVQDMLERAIAQDKLRRSLEQGNVVEEVSYDDYNFEEGNYEQTFSEHNFSEDYSTVGGDTYNAKNIGQDYSEELTSEEDSFEEGSFEEGSFEQDSLGRAFPDSSSERALTSVVEGDNYEEISFEPNSLRRNHAQNSFDQDSLEQHENIYELTTNKHDQSPNMNAGIRLSSRNAVVGQGLKTWGHPASRNTGGSDTRYVERNYSISDGTPLDHPSYSYPANSLQGTSDPTATSTAIKSPQRNTEGEGDSFDEEDRCELDSILDSLEVAIDLMEDDLKMLENEDMSGLI